MHITCSLLVAFSSLEPPLIFPCRPCLTIRKQSPDLQQKSHIRELASSIASLCSLRYGARIVVVIRQFV